MRIGIDPGLTGAIALLNDIFQFIEVVDMPVMPLTDNRYQVNAAELAKLFRAWQYPSNVLTVYLERISARPGQGVSSMFGFGVSYGIVLGVLGVLQLPVVLVSPQTWKKRAGIPRRKPGQPIGVYKDFSRTLAQQLFPGAPLSLKKYTGRAEALLIARFGEKDRLL